MSDDGQGVVEGRGWWRREKEEATRLGADGCGPSQDVRVRPHQNDRAEGRSPALVSIIESLARAAGDLLGHGKVDTEKIKLARWYEMERVAREYWRGGVSPTEAIERTKTIFRGAVARGVLEVPSRVE